MRQIVFFCLMFASMQGSSQPNSPAKLVNPDGVMKPNGYSHAAEIDLGTCRMIIISGQVSMNEKGELIGINDLTLQTTQVFKNLETIIKSFGGSMHDVVKLNYFVLNVKDVQLIRDVRDKFVNLKSPPASSLVEVSRLFRPELLIEVEATAIIKK